MRAFWRLITQPPNEYWEVARRRRTTRYTAMAIGAAAAAPKAVSSMPAQLQTLSLGSHDHRGWRIRGSRRA